MLDRRFLSRRFGGNFYAVTRAYRAVAYKHVVHIRIQLYLCRIRPNFILLVLRVRFRIVYQPLRRVFQFHGMEYQVPPVFGIRFPS